MSRNQSERCSKLNLQIERHSLHVQKFWLFQRMLQKSYYNVLKIKMSSDCTL